MKLPNIILTLLAFFLSGLLSLSAQCGLQSGPMNGASAMLEAKIWVQTKCSQEVFIEYWSVDDPSFRYYSESIFTEKSKSFTAHLVANQVQPAKKYNYRLYIDGRHEKIDYPLSFQTQPLWQWRTDPPDFTFLAGSCAYVGETELDRPGNPYGGEYEIFTQMNKEQDAEMMMWLGDNTYLREADWNSKTGIYHRYTHTRSLPELQPFLGSKHHFAIWDDHDFGPNDSDGSYWGKDMTLQAFKDFWANPNIHVGGSEGITGTAFWNDCQFFLMDNRWYRSAEDAQGQILGEKQVHWLIDALRFSQASFKFICIGSQVVSDLAEFENYANFSTERQALIDSIDKYQIEGVVFLTGDRHHSEVSHLKTKNGIDLYDITASPLTSGSYDHSSEANNNRVEGSIIGKRNYAKLTVTGPWKKRQLQVQFIDKNGTVLYTQQIGISKD